MFEVSKDVSTLYRKMQMQLNNMLAPISLSSAKTMFIFCLEDHKRMTQSEICTALDMDKSTVAKMLVRLEDEGYVTKEINPDDIRSFLVRPTEKALSVSPEARRIHNLWVDGITCDLSPIEKSIFIELLSKVAARASIYSENE